MVQMLAAGQAAPPEHPPGGHLTVEAAVRGGLSAALLAGVIMLLLRQVAEVRTLPERLLEWALLFVPLDVFEAGQLWFGVDFKRYALYAAIAGMLLLLAALGALALGRGWGWRGSLALGLGLWLLTMLVLMPLTSAGFFATELIDGTWPAVLGYLTVALTYAAGLAVPRPVADQVDSASTAADVNTSRRSAAIMLVGALTGLAGATLLRELAPRASGLPVRALDPQEPVPSGGVEPPNPHPEHLALPQPAIAAPAELDSPPPASRLPEPPDSKPLSRDDGGGVATGGRKPGELAAPITSTDAFYIVTKNPAGDPVLHPESWRLRIDGEVEQAINLDYATLRSLPAVEVTKTLECISNLVARCDLAPFGCELIGTARWTGVRLSDLFALAGGLRSGVVGLTTISADELTTTLPIQVALDPDTLLVYEMNGEVLPREHGYPARVLVPGHYGMKNAKWVVALRPVAREVLDWYGQRQWTREGRVKTMTRIDTPAPNTRVALGPQRVAGIAYAGGRGVSKVEVSADGGQTWQTARFLEPAAGRDTWVRWETTVTLVARTATTLVARATDGTGVLQPEAFSLPQPDGGAGWHTVELQL
jgi:DMSO/TMAO reductase YedYZ molybdopterin-dependent catalytic subunit